MNRLGSTLLVGALCTGLSASSLLAQTSSGDANDAGAQSAQGVQSAADPSQAPSGSGAQEGQYAPALNGAGLIPMFGGASRHILVGAASSGGFDSNPDDLSGGRSSGLYTLSPYVGLQKNTEKTQYLLQYQPTFTNYTSKIYAGQAMNIASARIVSKVNERWSWDFKAMGSHGQDSVRLLAPQQTVAVGAVPGAGPSSGSYVPDAGTVTYISGEWAADYNKSERDGLELRLADSYGEFKGLEERNSIATTALVYTHALSSQLSMTTYGQVSYYYGSINCSSVGAGIGIRWQVSENALLSLSGGPQYDSAVCGHQQGASYNAAFSARLSAGSQIYLLAAREPNTSYLGPGLWQQSASGGYQRRLTSASTVGIDAGYVASDTLIKVSSYHGTFVDAAVGYAIGYGVKASLGYRDYMGDWGGANFTRNIALFSLAWAPNAGRLFQ